MWECAELLTSKSLPLGADLDVIHDVHRLKTPLDHSVSTATDRLEELYGHWDKIVSSYGAADLTYHEDRPIAIAGLARSFCQDLGLQSSDYAVDFGGRG